MSFEELGFDPEDLEELKLTGEAVELQTNFEQSIKVWVSQMLETEHFSDFKNLITAGFGLTISMQPKQQGLETVPEVTVSVTSFEEWNQNRLFGGENLT